VDVFTPNPSQQKAIEFPMERPLKIIAGAGTGKTEVLARRFVYLVKHYKLRPHHIVALTFTKKAAAEMRRRIVALLGAEGLVDRNEAALLTWIGNFHSISLILLKQHPLLVGLDPSFEIVDEVEQIALLRNVLNDFLNNRLSESNENRFEDLLIDSPDNLQQDILAIINRLKSNFIHPQDVKKQLLPLLKREYRNLISELNATIDDSNTHASTKKAFEKRLAAIPLDEAYEQLFLNAVYVIYRSYRERLADKNLLDYNDLIFYAHTLMNNNPDLRKNFEYILVDEFQDTDSGQYRLLETMSRRFQNVTVVGDPKQLIYEWREAKLENMNKFPGETVPLEENYRSFGQVLDVANRFIRNTMPGEPPLRTASQGGRGNAGEARVNLVYTKDRETEAVFVARQIKGLIERGRCPGEIAVLMRTIHSSRAVEEALSASGIPYVTVGGCGFYDLQDIKDISALLRLVGNPFDDQPMVRMLQTEMIGLSDASLYHICRQREGEITSIYDAIKQGDLSGFRPASADRMRQLVRLVEELAALRWSISLAELFSRALKGINYLKYLSSRERPRGPRFMNVAQFYKIASQYEERHPRDGLDEFLLYLETAASCDLKAQPGNAAAEKVQLMTIHQAKGLEFPIVFLVGVTPTGFRGGNFGYDEDFGIYVKRRPDGTFIVRYEGGYGRIERQLRERRYLEENRIIYVALTRTRDLLYITAYGPRKEEEKDFFSTLQAFASNMKHCITASVLEDAADEEDTAAPAEVSHAAGANIDLPLEQVLDATATAVERIVPVSPAAAPAAPPVPEFSYSKLALFRRCPRHYAFRYVYGFATTDEFDFDGNFGDGAGRLLGDLLHQTLMYYHRGMKRKQKMNAHKILDDLGPALDCPRQVLNRGHEFLQKYLDSHLSKKETVFEEKEFNWKIVAEGFTFIVKGTVDHVQREGDSLKIIDYKSGLKKPDDHRLQLALYKMALEEILGVTGMLTSNFYLSSGEEVTHHFSHDELADVRSRLLVDAREIVMANYSRSNEPEKCGICEFKSLCR